MCNHGYSKMDTKKWEGGYGHTSNTAAGPRATCCTRKGWAELRQQQQATRSVAPRNKPPPPPGGGGRSTGSWANCWGEGQAANQRKISLKKKAKKFALCPKEVEAQHLRPRNRQWVKQHHRQNRASRWRMCFHIYFPCCTQRKGGENCMSYPDNNNKMMQKNMKKTSLLLHSSVHEVQQQQKQGRRYYINRNYHLLFLGWWDNP
mmetsp:Transcript_25173/g.39654  ORF Transcript_25173/g.39654 Transcript_25173/m.39654 type:complete len:204 (-) Transcript_25173:134-745(-)